MKVHFQILLLACCASGIAVADDVILQIQPGIYARKDPKDPNGLAYIPATAAQYQAQQNQVQEQQKVSAAQQLGTAAKQQMDAFERSVKVQMADIVDKQTGRVPWNKDELSKEQDLMQRELSEENILKSMSPQDLAAYFKNPSKNPALNDSIKNTLDAGTSWRNRWFGSTLPTTAGVESASKQFEAYLNSLKKAYQGVDDQHVSTVADTIAGKAAVVAAPAANTIVQATAARKAALPTLPTQTVTIVGHRQAAASTDSGSAAASNTSTTSGNSVAATTAASAVALAPAAPAVLTRDMRGTGAVVVGSANDYHPSEESKQREKARAAAAAAPEAAGDCLGLQFSDASLTKAGVDGKKAASMKQNECVPGSFTVGNCDKRYYYDPEMTNKQCLQVCKHNIFGSSYSQDIYNTDVLDMLDSPDTKDAAKSLLSQTGTDEAEFRQKIADASTFRDQGRVPFKNDHQAWGGDSQEKMQQVAIALNKALPEDKSNGNYCAQMAVQSKTVLAQAEKGKDSPVTSTATLKKLAPDNYNLQAQCTNPSGDVTALKIKHWFSSDELMVVESVKDNPGHTGQVLMNYDYWDSSTKTWKNNVMQLQSSQNPAGLVNGDGDHLDLHQVAASALPKGFCTGAAAGAGSGSGGTTGTDGSTTGPGIK